MDTRDFEQLCRDTPVHRPIFSIENNIPYMWESMGIKKGDEFMYQNNNSLLHINSGVQYSVYPSKMKFVEYRLV